MLICCTETLDPQDGCHSCQMREIFAHVLQRRGERRATINEKLCGVSTMRRGVNTYPACIRTHVHVYVYTYTGGVGRKSARAQSLRTEPLHTQSISQSEHAHTQTHTHRHTDFLARDIWGAGRNINFSLIYTGDIFCCRTPKLFKKM